MNGERDRQDGNNSAAGVSGNRKEYLKLAVKILLVVLIFGVVFYLIYFSVGYSEADFILSGQEITSARDKTVKKYKTGDKVFFFISRGDEKLGASLFIIEIDYFENNEYQRYKQISYELDNSYPQLGACIPRQYFSRPGRYQIKASLDGKVVGTRKIKVAQ